MSITVELKAAPDLKAVILAALPNYRKRRSFVTVFPPSGVNVNSYWDGGSKSEYAIVHLETHQRRALPTSTHPYFDVAARGLANQSGSVIETDRVGNVRLKVLPEGFALVEGGTFCGKSAAAHVDLNPANMPKYLTA